MIMATQSSAHRFPPLSDNPNQLPLVADPRAYVRAIGQEMQYGVVISYEVVFSGLQQFHSKLLSTS